MIKTAIIRAACRYKDEVFSIPVPARHGDVLKWMFQEYGREYSLGCEQGFVDADFNFLNRRDAKKRAMEWKQMLKETDKEELFSEDLW